MCKADSQSFSVYETLPKNETEELSSVHFWARLPPLAA